MFNFVLGVCRKRKPLSPNLLGRIFRVVAKFVFAFDINKGTQREYSSKPLKHSIFERILVFQR